MCGKASLGGFSCENQYIQPFSPYPTDTKPHPITFFRRFLPFPDIHEKDPKSKKSWFFGDVISEGYRSITGHTNINLPLS